MREAIALAQRGRGGVEPNPLVGCVLMKDGVIVGRGLHKRFGENHAEANALLEAGDRARGATAIVTLEPCSHEWPGKKQPACAGRLIEAGVAKVVVGCVDPNPNIAGRGLTRLRDAGIDVVVGVLEAECRQMLGPFLAGILHKRPYITLKWATSADGRVAGRAGRPVQITNPTAAGVMHALRGLHDAIAVGTNTVVNDNPSLTVRRPAVFDALPLRTPTRVVLSNGLSVPSDARLFTGGPRRLVFTSETAAERAAAQVAELENRGVDVVVLPAVDNGRGGRRFSFADVLTELHRRDVMHLMIETGPKLAGDLIASNQWDRILRFDGQMDIGMDGLAAPRTAGVQSWSATFNGDRLSEFLNDQSKVFAAAEPSADLLLVDSLANRSRP